MSDERRHHRPADRTEGASPLCEGVVLGHYRILRAIGRGGMGEVFLAHDEHLGREVALKVLAPEAMGHPDARRRFRREAHALSRLNHPDIATIFDFDTQDGVDFLVMEYVEGETLSRRLRRSRFCESELLDLGIQICETLVEAHTRGVLHRDLTPRNIMISDRGTVKVLDFGLAKLLSHEPTGTAPTDTMSVTRQIAGTVPYIAPERLRGRPADERADIYSLGAVLYEMATGQRVFEGDSRAELIAATLDQEPRTVRRITSEISADVERCIQKALDKDPRRRYQSARELAVDLERARTPASPGSRSPISRRWWIGFTLVLLAMGTVHRFGLWDRPPLPEARAMVALVTGPEFEAGSRISPDGQWISYQTSTAAGTELWVQPTNGGEARRVAEITGSLHSHCWSPDALVLALVRRSGDENLLQTLPIFGGPVDASISLPASIGICGPIKWSGSTVYIDAPRTGLWRVHLDSRHAERLLAAHGEEGPRFEFDVCEDGQRAVYTVAEENRHTLWAVELPAGRPRRITEHEHSDIRPRWVGSECRGVVHASNRTGQPDLWYTDLYGKTARLTFSGDVEYAESVSRDGTLLSLREEADRGDLWILDPDRPEAASRITADTLEDVWPSAALFTSRIVFQRRARTIEEFDPVSQSELLIGDLERGRLQDLRVVAPRGGLARISPDGRWVAYLRSVGAGARELVLLELDSGRVETVDRLVSLPGFASVPFEPLWSNTTWTETGGELLYCTKVGTTYQIRAATPSFGGSPRSLMETTEGVLEQPRLTPDGLHLVYVLEQQLQPVEAEGTIQRLAVRTELRRRSMADGSEVVLLSEVHEADGFLEILGPDANSGWYVLRHRRGGKDASANEVLHVDDTGSSTVLFRLEGVVGAGALDPDTRRLYLSWMPEGQSAWNLYLLDLEAKNFRLLTENQQPTAVFSRPQLLPGGQLLYTRHDSNSDIWLIHLGP